MWGEFILALVAGLACETQGDLLLVIGEDIDAEAASSRDGAMRLAIAVNADQHRGWRDRHRADGGSGQPAPLRANARSDDVDGRRQQPHGRAKIIGERVGCVDHGRTFCSCSSQSAAEASR